MNFFVAKTIIDKDPMPYHLIVKSGRHFVPVVFYNENHPSLLKFSNEKEAISFYLEHKKNLNLFLVKNKSKKIIYVPQCKDKPAHFQILQKDFIFWKPHIRSHPLTGDYPYPFDDFESAYNYLIQL